VTTRSHSPSRRAARVRRWGRLAWAALGIIGVLVVAWYTVSLLALVVVPLLLALFPATLLYPLVKWLRGRGMHRTLAAILSLLVGIFLFAVVGGFAVTMVVNGLPELLDSAEGGLSRIEGIIQTVRPDAELNGWSDLFNEVRGELPVDGALPGRVLSVTFSAFHLVAGIMLTLVILFFYLRSGPRMAKSLVSLAPPETRDRVLVKARASWESLGAYFRGQLLVALVDGVFIGIGLLLLGIPLAIPLAILVFFGGLFPIVGAVVTGSVAVLVALSHGGLTLGLVVAGLVLLVQQLEGNVLEPLILSEAIGLHPLVIILSITAGGVLLGVLGAFLAVPVATVVRVLLEPEEAPTS
jgi:putative heme transporter